MDETYILNVLFVAVLLMSIILIIVSAASLGKQLGDAEYQQAMGLNGIRRLQSNINIRKHVTRLYLGFVFCIVGFIAFTATDLITRMWISRILFATMLAMFTYTCIFDWYDEYKQLKIIMKTNPSEGLGLIRVQIHSINSTVQEIIGARVLSKANVNDKNIIMRCDEALHELTDKLAELQRLVRERDPAYKFEKYNKLHDEVV